jgi:hypothetical protein
MVSQLKRLVSAIFDWLAGAGEDCEQDSGDDHDDDDDDDDGDSDMEVDPALVQQSLLTTPASPTFRDWEKYTRVSWYTLPGFLNLL